MSPREAAEAVGINKLTILRWIHSGKLAATRTETGHGPGYDIRPEDLRDAVQTPKKKREPRQGPIPGSVSERIEELKALVTQQAAEIHELRGELHAMHERVIRALPEPKQHGETPRRRRLWPFGGRKEGKE